MSAGPEEPDHQIPTHQRERGSVNGFHATHVNPMAKRPARREA
jgi:hypothetical protein